MLIINLLGRDFEMDVFWYDFNRQIKKKMKQILYNLFS